MTAVKLAVSAGEDQRDLRDIIAETGRKAREAARGLALASSDAKNGALITMAAMLRISAMPSLRPTCWMSRRPSSRDGQARSSIA